MSPHEEVALTHEEEAWIQQRAKEDATSLQRWGDNDWEAAKLRWKAERRELRAAGKRHHFCWHCGHHLPVDAFTSTCAYNCKECKNEEPPQRAQNQNWRDKRTVHGPNRISRRPVRYLPRAIRLQASPSAPVQDHERLPGERKGCKTNGKPGCVTCQTCNAGLGHFDHDPDKLRAAVRYLERGRRRATPFLCLV
jgi:hypothetical protein